MNKKFVYQVGNNKKVILWCTANQISTQGQQIPHFLKCRLGLFLWSHNLPQYT